MCVGLVACSDSSSSGSETDNSSATTTPSAANGDLAALVAAAEAEGQLVWDTFQNDTEASTLVDAFEKQYPKIDVSYRREAATALRALEEQEIAAGQEGFDIVSAPLPNDLISWADQGRLVSVKDLPAYGDVPSEWKFAKDQVVTYYTVAMGLAYNTDLVKGNDIPTNYEDLLDPKWNGLIGLTSLPIAASQQVSWTLLSEFVGPDFASQIGKTNPQLFTSSADQAQALASGQLAFSLNITTSSVKNIYDKGAPVAIANTPEIPALLNVSGIYAKAKHPNAAKLFLNWMLSADSKDAFLEQTYLNPAGLETTTDMGVSTPIMKGISPSSYRFLQPDALDPDQVAIWTKELGF